MVKNEKDTDRRESFITNNMGDFLRDVLPSIAAPVALWGTILFLVLFGLSFICHWQVVCNLFSLVSGFTLITIVYVLSVVFILDLLLLHKVCSKQPPYKVTVIWGICLILLGVGFMILTSRYKKQYRFECAEWYVEESTGLYHCTNECEDIEDEIYSVKGHEIKNKDLKLCEWCKEYIEDMDFYYEPIRRP